MKKPDGNQTPRYCVDGKQLCRKGLLLALAPARPTIKGDSLTRVLSISIAGAAFAIAASAMSVQSVAYAETTTATTAGQTAIVLAEQSPGMFMDATPAAASPDMFMDRRKA